MSVLTRLALLRPLTAYVLMLLLVVLGLRTYQSLPRESFPEVKVPLIFISTVYPGASPSDVENQVTRKIETELQGLSGLKEIRSTSYDGYSVVETEFNPDVDLDTALQKVREKVDRARPDLPVDIEEPILTDVDFSRIPIQVISLAAEFGMERLTSVADDLKDRLEAIPGVNLVTVVGSRDREVHVLADPRRLTAYDLGLGDLVDTVAREHLNLPGGELDIGRQSYLVRLVGEVRDPSEILDFVVSDEGGRPVRVSDVATVVYGFEDETTRSRLNGRTAVSLTVEKRTGANILDVASAVQAEVDRTREGLPPTAEIRIVTDQSIDIRDMNADLENNILSGLTLVLVVLFVALGLRPAVIVSSAIPLSMLITYLVLAFLGQTLNMIVLFSLVLLLGMLVDNAIVTVENIYRHRERGDDPMTAAREGASEVAMPIAASTATTLCAFGPLLFWPGIIGDFMSYLPLTLIIGLIASLFVALVFNPTLALRLFRKPPKARPVERRRPWTDRYVAILRWCLRPAPEETRSTLRDWIVPWVPLAGIVATIPLVAADETASATVVGLVSLVALVVVALLIRDHQPRVLARDLIMRWLPLAGIVATIPLVAAGVTSLAVLVGLASAVALSVGVALVGGDHRSLALARDWIVPWVPLAGIVATIPLIAAGRTMTAVVVGLVSVVALAVVVALARDHRSRVLAVVAAMLFGTFAVYGEFGHGQEFFPEIDPREIWVDLEFPSGTNLEAQDRLMVELEDLLADTPDGLDRIANVGSTGLSQDPGSAGGATNESRLTLRLARFHERGQPSTRTLAEVREKVGVRSEARVKVDKLEDGPPTGKAVSVRLMGDDYALLGEAARALRERMDRTPGLLNVGDDYDTGLPEYTVRVDRVAAARANTDTRAIATEIRTALAGTEVAKFRDGEDEWEIVVRLPEDDRRSSDRLEELTILDEDGRPIPLRSLVTIESSSGPAAIRRVDLRRTIVVDADVDYAAGFRDADGREAVAAALEGDLAPPRGISWEFGGADEFERESTEFLTQAFWVAILLIALILVTEFDSLITPVTILVAVVLSLIGVLWGLMLTGTPFGIIMTGIGVISLAGIVVNNAIVLCDFIFQERRKGRSRSEAIVEAGRVRMRPVLLTAVTTVLGLIPLTTGINFDFRSLTLQVGSESTQWWGPMGVAVICGLTVSTAFTLLVVPVTFDVLDGLSERFRSRRSRPA